MHTSCRRRVKTFRVFYSCHVLHFGRLKNFSGRFYYKNGRPLTFYRVFENVFNFLFRRFYVICVSFRQLGAGATRTSAELVHIAGRGRSRRRPDDIVVYCQRRRKSLVVCRPRARLRHQQRRHLQP